MPSARRTPIERTGLTDAERFEDYIRTAIHTSLARCWLAGWIGDPRLDEDKIYNLEATAADVLRQLQTEGLQVTPSGLAGPVL